MNKLFKGVRSVTNNKDDVIKKSITAQLSSSVKEIQYVNVGDAKASKNSEVTEAANTLCTTIEAIFLHGLKDTLSHRFKRAIADVDEQPEPNFWAPLLIISHREIIDQIMNLPQISTEVGKCRAWIRLALNDCLLSSYLMTLRQDSSALKSYYSVDAYIRDSELLDVAQRLIEGVEAFKTFTLPFNSSLLNTWTLPSLFLSGIWAPTMKACPVAPCDDVVQIITDPQPIPETSSETVSLSSAMSFTSQGSGGLRQIVALTEDAVLKIILGKDAEGCSSSQSIDDLKSSCSSDQEKGTDLENINYPVGNSLTKRTGWSFDEAQEFSDMELPEDIETRVTSKEQKSMEASFNDIIKNHSMSGGFIRTPDFKEVLQKFEEDKRDDVITENSNSDETESMTVIPSAYLTKTESTSLSAHIGIIAKEKGLDVQNFECAECKKPLELPQNVCAFTGFYFCNACMSNELLPIPARIVHNWDFKDYPISKKALNYINEIKDHPVIDFKVLNPYVYSVAPEMAELQGLRIQLNFLRAYLYTCREPVIEQLQKQMWPREYMYEHIHQYSILDLSEIPNGILAQKLQKVVLFGKEHVANCWLCSQKGFVCEVCNKPKALFPFDVKHVYRCDLCNGVYHKTCLNSLKPCPKCERRKRREELPLLGAVTQ